MKFSIQHSAFCIAVALAAASATADPAVSVVVAPERKVLASDKPETAVVKVGLTGAALPAGERPAVNLALVLDRSGSMQGDRIVRAREAAIAAVQRLDERDYVSVVVFDDRIDVLAGAQTASEANKAAIIEKLRTVEARGATAIFGGVSAGASEIRKNLARKLVNRIVLLSDGAANVGPSSPEELGLLGASLVKEGVSVSTLGVGLGYNENLMAALATRSDGNTYFIENGDDIPRSVRFRDAHPVELIGRDGRIEDGVVTVDFNQIYSRQEKYVLVRTEFPVGKDGETREFAAAEVSWVLPGSDAAGSAAATGSVAFSADAAKVKASADAKVLVQSVKTQNALRTQRARRCVQRRMLAAARDYARAKGFKGTFLIEPKPMEPTKHQYDVDTETVIGFLRANGLDKDFKVNIEVTKNMLANASSEIRPIRTTIERVKTINNVRTLQFYGMFGSSLDFKTNKIQVGLDFRQKYLLGVSGIRWGDKYGYTIDLGVKF